MLPEPSDVVDGTLRLGHKPGTTVVSDNPVRYQVTLPDLAGIDLSGAGRITGHDLELASLDVDITGAGAVDLSGSVDRQDVRLSGAGRYQAGDLVSQVATAELSGTGADDPLPSTVSSPSRSAAREPSAIPATRASTSPSAASAD